MFRLLKPKFLLGLVVIVAACSLITGLVLTTNAAGLDWNPALVLLLVLILAGTSGWVAAYRLHGLANRLQRDLSSAQEAAATASWRDPVSGLATYRLFDAALHNAFERAQRYSQPFSVLLIEVSGAGGMRVPGRSPAQDALLRFLGSVLQVNSRSSDISARLSESMLGLVLAETDQDGAQALWQRLRAVAYAQWPEQRSWSISGGVAAYSVDCTSVEGLMADADRRLALEKRRLRAEPEA
jgi:diguanylate cyclase (GGDEF)-like protein